MNDERAEREAFLRWWLDRSGIPSHEETAWDAWQTRAIEGLTPRKPDLSMPNAWAGLATAQEAAEEVSNPDALRATLDLMLANVAGRNVTIAMPDGDSIEAPADELRAALAEAPQPARQEAGRLPPGWYIEMKGDLLGTVTVTAPNGYSAVTTAISSNPANVLRMLLKDLMPRTPAAPDATPSVSQPNYSGCTYQSGPELGVLIGSEAPQQEAPIIYSNVVSNDPGLGIQFPDAAVSQQVEPRVELSEPARGSFKLEESFLTAEWIDMQWYAACRQTKFPALTAYTAAVEHEVSSRVAQLMQPDRWANDLMQKVGSALGLSAGSNLTIKLLPELHRRLGAQDGYADAFYELAKLMDIGARTESPRTVWEQEMLPRLRALLRAQPAKPTEKGLTDRLSWLGEFRNLLSEFYEAGRTAPARERANAAIMAHVDALHLEHTALGWKPRAYLAAQPVSSINYDDSGPDVSHLPRVSQPVAEPREMTPIEAAHLAAKHGWSGLETGVINAILEAHKLGSRWGRK